MLLFIYLLIINKNKKLYFKRVCNREQNAFEDKSFRFISLSILFLFHLVL